MPVSIHKDNHEKVVCKGITGEKQNLTSVLISVDYKQFSIHFNDYLKERRLHVLYTINNEEVTLETQGLASVLETQNIASLQKEVERQLFLLWYRAATDEEIAARRDDSELINKLFREYADDIKEIDHLYTCYE